MKIKEYLEKYGVTLQQMADELGVTAPAVLQLSGGSYSKGSGNRQKDCQIDEWGGVLRRFV
jgi:transcriptional regulator with XRE-family HTH domain